ncbi:hypothetical protein KP509_18G003700 [Ceratopteris richardii]|uniref:WRKY domain-containing protein n=1 Tax=Ceratopteris richardii TaxID=49495 RepID=A0A8T2SQD8_CERRI|nr:hypothetical protein KP509_18G003700 [Ceratopteris richardii]
MDVTNGQTSMVPYHGITHFQFPAESYKMVLQDPGNNGVDTFNYVSATFPVVSGQSSRAFDEINERGTAYGSTVSPVGLSHMAMSTINIGACIPAPECLDFHQICDDQLDFFSIAGHGPHEDMHSIGQIFGAQSVTRKSSFKSVPEPSSAVKSAGFSAVSSELGRCEDVLQIKHEHVDADRRILLTPSLTQRYGVSCSTSASETHPPSKDLVVMDYFSKKGLGFHPSRTSEVGLKARVASVSSTLEDRQLEDYKSRHRILNFSTFTSFPETSGHDLVINDHSQHEVRRQNQSGSRYSVSRKNSLGMTNERSDAAFARGKIQAPQKRRKTQMKKVIYVPATGGVDRPTGECLPSDSWAWRKYGQKPIKNSPFPRSYYKCSSVKGCTARKQVERSPSDPTIIMITYTVEHSHPAAGASSTDQEQIAPEPEEAENEKDETALDEKQTSGSFHPSADGNEATSSEESCDPAIASEGNPPEISNDGIPLSDDDQSKPEHQEICNAQTHVDWLLEDDITNMMERHASDAEELFAASVDESAYPSAFMKIKPDEDLFTHLGELPDLLNRNIRWFQHHNSSSAAAGADASAAMDSTPPMNIDSFDLIHYWP